MYRFREKSGERESGEGAGGVCSLPMKRGSIKEVCHKEVF